MMMYFGNRGQEVTATCQIGRKLRETDGNCCVRRMKGMFLVLVGMAKNIRK